MLKRLAAEHGTVCCFRDDSMSFGYFGWPTVIRTGEDGLLVGSSGFRTQHIDPFGKTVIFASKDSGRRWGAPAVINDSPIDDRDVGLLDLGGGRVLATWFSQDTRVELAGRDWSADSQRIDLNPVLNSWDDDVVERNCGSFVRIRDASGRWGRRTAVAVSSPHGPVRLSDGRILYVGRVYTRGPSSSGGQHVSVRAIVSADGEHWETLSELPTPAGTGNAFFCEPHAVELPSGRILVMLRAEPQFAIYQCHSDDAGKSWSTPKFVVCGSPPHLLRHSSGALICTYGYRSPGYGQRVLLSRDDGKSYEQWILRDDGVDSDLGYPSTVELSDGTLYSVYYQRPAPGMLNNGILSSRWELPEPGGETVFVDR